MSNTHVILIWEGSGSPTEVYVIPECPDFLLKCNNAYVGDDCDPETSAALIRLSDALLSKEADPKYLANPEDPYAQAWSKHMVHPGSELDFSEKMVVVFSGWH
jgi:hypothetical protein